MNTQDLIKKYSELNPYKLSKETVARYNRYINDFFKFSGMEYREITKAEIEKWKKDLSKKGYAYHSIRKYLSALKSFYRFCKHEGFVAVDPTEREIKPFWIIDNDNLFADTREKLNEYLDSLLINSSDETIRDRRNILNRFFTKNNISIKEISYDVVLKWITEGAASRKPVTVNHEISVIKNFFRFCLKEGYIAVVPFKKRWRLKTPKPLPRFLEPTDLALVKLTVENMFLRDRALVEFFLSSGCRVSEVVNLNVDSLDFTNNSTKVLGKGKKSRIVHFSETAAFLLKEYLKKHPKTDNALFLNCQGRRLSRGGIEILIKKIRKESGLQKILTPHVFRHTFASGLLYKGADLSYIQDELGHKHLSTTTIYARLLNQDIRKMYRKIMG